MSLTALVDRKGNECLAEPSQVAALKAAGWREPADALGSYKLIEGDKDDGGEQHAGRPLDLERREREDESGTVDAIGVEQPESPDGNGPESG